MKKPVWFIGGLLLLFSAEILRVYFIMPFPGSQRQDSIRIAYFLHNNISWIRIAGLILCLPSFVYHFKRAGIKMKMLLLLPVTLYVFVWYAFQFRFMADKMFYQPVHRDLVGTARNTVDTNELVIGISMAGASRAYPIQVIGYHHQVKDTICGMPILVTYCTVCRSGRIYSPMVGGRYETFRLVGMDHFNAMFEDGDTRSWWRQVNGEAIAGPLKGMKLREIPSAQMRLGAWIRENPGTLILQPDSIFSRQYGELRGFDSGTIKSSLERRDSASWKSKSWVVGVSNQGHAKAYDWNDLVNQKLINDSIPFMPLLIVLENDSVTFHVMNRRCAGMTLTFLWNESASQLQDEQTHSLWSWTGTCIRGPLSGGHLDPVQSYQEFWHSWHFFHPATARYEPPGSR